MRPLEVSFIVNLHREGRLCLPSIETALTAVQAANQAGVAAELVLILDNPDSITISAAKRFETNARIELTNVRDLGAARNHGVGCALGRYIAFLDGDDLCCRNWLVAAYREAKQFSNPCIVHPKFNLFFGRDYSRYFWMHPDVRKDCIKLSRLLVENLWTSSVFAEKDTFIHFPYVRNDLKNGVGYEDWAFNVETAIAGVKHIVAQDTILFIRRNKESSLLVASAAHAVMPDFGRVFARYPSFMDRIDICL
ncbi:glycosyl transferase family 2 [Methylobacterium sp. B4]|nr:glycosyl transferase family 2 [Methylobacterium sp. B4]